MIVDKDLLSIQEVRHLLQQAKTAQAEIERMTQEQIDRIVKEMAEATRQEARKLADMAHEETGYGIAADKLVKNMFAATEVYHSIKDLKTVGIIARDERRKVWDVAQPVGVVAGIIPSTNPTSTVIFKSLIAVKARNAIVFSPHPQATRCSVEATRILQLAADSAGAPAGLLACITQPTLAATQELMTHKMTNVILATGGIGMVKAAYSSGKPAYGVGPGNVPVYIHSSANINRAVQEIIGSKTFDHGTICASEQAIIVDEAIQQKVIAALVQQGAFWLNDEQKEKVEAVILSNGSLNPAIVGQSPQKIANIAGIKVPTSAKVLIAHETEVGKHAPLSVEKLSPILAFYTVSDWQEACKLSIALLELGGLGHSLGIHCEDMKIIEAFAVEKPASRIIVNAGTTFGAIGATTGIQPSMTLGCGSFGNNITSDNIGPMHLLNVKRVAFGIKEMARANQGEQSREKQSANVVEQSNEKQSVNVVESAGEIQVASKVADQVSGMNITREEIMSIIQNVLAEMKN
ncbi:acetaldehyde dehydrogenase (acetylating) [Brevibacillus sp. SYSU BS000544]|uniref:acetaldehyde dehydrogenase (acetylating) n=1 Tax=Brevibacillus sp. SYSU BS000544 TaxID=3416443 RepID=UPI003CE47ED6